MSKYAGFTSVQVNRPQRSHFDLSHQKRMSVRMGPLYPCLVAEAVPGDTFDGSSDCLLRLMPLLAPIYDQIELYVHFFFAPIRPMWEDYEEFFAAGNKGGFTNEAVPIPPYFDIGYCLENFIGDSFEESSLSDYLGVPVLPIAPATANDYDGKKIMALPHVAYQWIWSEYYRDRNFIKDDEAGYPTFPVASGDLGADSGMYLFLRQRNYIQDYFTSALPNTQRGTEILIPMEAAVTYRQQTAIRRSDNDALMTNNDLVFTTQAAPAYAGGSAAMQNAPNIDGTAIKVDNIESISNGSSTINDFRAAYTLQLYYELMAIGGTRYTEVVEVNFGVRNPDSRLQRPEYLGGGRIDVQISEVVTTAWSVDSDAVSVPAGNMAGHGITYGNTNKFHYFIPEHGYIIGILSIMNKPSYHQGLPKMFQRWSFLDWVWPVFAKLGEQQVDKSEIYASPANLTPGTDGLLPLFGYQSRYADWKQIPNTNHGAFHSTLLFWTLTRHFSDSPELGAAFNIFDESTQDRIFAVENEDNFLLYLHNRVSVRRCLPFYGTPNTMGFI